MAPTWWQNLNFKLHLKNIPYFHLCMYVHIFKSISEIFRERMSFLIWFEILIKSDLSSSSEVSFLH